MMRRDRSTGNSAADSARRAEEIRRRRTSRSQEKISKVSNRISSPAPARPITVRGRSQEGGESFKNAFRSTPLYRQAGTRPRRQFYVAMDSASGSELRLPAIPMINPGWRSISAILAVLAIIGIFSLLNSPFFRVTMVEVDGLQRLNGADLQAVLRLENLSIIEIQPDNVKETIAVSFPELADVNVEVSLPNAIRVTARERQPILAWKKGDTVMWIDAEGYVFPARGELPVENTAPAAEGQDANAAAAAEGQQASAALVTINTDFDIPLAPLSNEELEKLKPLATANPPEYERIMRGDPTPVTSMVPGVSITSGIVRRADMTLLNSSLQLMQKLPAGTEVIYDQLNGLGWNDPGDFQVFVGKDLTNFEAKFALYQAILTELNNQGIHPNLISVEHLNAPFYRAEHDVPVEQ